MKATVESKVTLELSNEEAKVLKDLTGYISGQAHTPGRAVTTALWNALEAAGVESDYEVDYFTGELEAVQP